MKRGKGKGKGEKEKGKGATESTGKKTKIALLELLIHCCLSGALFVHLEFFNINLITYQKNNSLKQK